MMKYIVIILIIGVLVTLIPNFSSTIFAQQSTNIDNQKDNSFNFAVASIGDVMKMPKKLQKIFKVKILNS